MRVLITGGLGFQGAHLTRALLARGDEVSVLNTPGDQALAVSRSLVNGRSPYPTIIWGSVTDSALVERAVHDKHIVVHMAAVTNPNFAQANPLEALSTNVLGTQTVLEACRHHSKLLVLASSCEVYGPPVSDVDQTEHAPMHPSHVYGASKAAGDVLAQAYARSFGMPVTILRPCNVYGPGQKLGQFGAVIPTMVGAALSNDKLITVFGGAQEREFLYIDDLVGAYLRVVDWVASKVRFDYIGLPPAPSIFNVGSGERCSIWNLALAIARLVGGGTEVTSEPPRASEPHAFRLESQPFQSTFGWKATVTLEEGLRRFIKFAQRQGA